jgi:hypothetical protein
MKQTAVEWLWDALDNILELYPSEWEKISKVVEQAKEMEKGQIEQAFNEGREERDYNGSIWECKSGLEYFNQTFNTEEK